MPIEKNNARALPYEINDVEETPTNARKIGSNKRDDGIAVVNEILFSTYDNMLTPVESNRMNGMVIAEPIRISKFEMVNFFSNANFPLADKESSKVEEYLKVYVRIPKEHMCIGIPADFDQALSIGSISNSTKTSQEKSLAHTLMHPYFFMAINEESSTSIEIPQVGDIVEVQFFDVLRTSGVIKKIVDRWIGTPMTLEDLKTSAPDAFQELNTPINSVFKSDQGPIAKEATNPEDISSLAPGPNVTVATGEVIPTVVVDNKLIDKKVAPHLVAMFRAAQSEGARIFPLSSGFRVGFIEDNITLEDLNLLTQDSKYKNWDGNPYPIAKKVPASQEKLRYKNCGPNGLDKDASCNPATAYPVRAGAAKGKKSGHMMGNAIDIVVGRYGNVASSKVPNSRPDLITKQYRWLSLNAWKYGFIRTVPTERWHWEFLPGRGQFSKVKRDNPLWDGQFNESIAVYEEE